MNTRLERIPPARAHAVDRFFESCLAGMLACGYLALLSSGYLERVPAVVLGLAILLRALRGAGVIRFDVEPRFAAVLVLSSAAYFLLDYTRLSRSLPSSALRLGFLLAVIAIVASSGKHQYFFVRVAAFAQPIAACLLAPGAAFLLFLGFFLLFGVGAFSSGEIRRSLARSPGGSGAPEARAGSLGLLAAAVAFGILVIAGGLFFLLPRTARAAIEHFAPMRHRLSGFSNEVNLGEIGEIKKNSWPVLHILMQGGGPPPPGLKWRGTALAEFDGRRWSNPPSLERPLPGALHGLYILATPSERRAPGPRLNYSVTANDAATDTLFLAGTPEFVWLDGASLIRSGPGSFRRFPPGGAFHYQARGILGLDPLPEETGGGLAPWERMLYLSQPPLDVRISQLARTAAAPAPDPAAKAIAIERYLAAHYGYTLQLPAEEPRDPIADFLFVRKKGHCEYFASSMALMLRTLGIPSRVVTGFQSGVYNPISGQQVIRASDAHSWVEAYLPSRGWTTFDPTPPDSGDAPSGLAERVWLYADAADLYWQQWVMNFTLDDQVLLAAKAEEYRRRFRLHWPEGLAGAAAFAPRLALGHAWSWLAVLAAAAIVWRYRAVPAAWFTNRTRVNRARTGRARPSDATLLYERMLRVLKRRGFERPVWQTPAEFARCLPGPSLAPLASEITTAYNEVRFGGQPARAAEMLRLLCELERRPSLQDS